MEIRIDSTRPYLKRIVKSYPSGKEPQRKTVQLPPHQMDLSHQNLEGLNREQLISVLEAHNLSPDKIIMVLMAFRML